ncbi:MAG: PIN domain-containing protein [Candidatus Cloacimonetes bacterium]|nr:PIN domain-containing protein [Candidatus Cloacimonadota bacterium]
MKLIDANIVLRFLLNDNVNQAELAAKIIEENEVVVLIEVLAEVVYVLTGVYQVPRHVVSKTLIEFSIIGNISFSDKIIAEKALEIFGTQSLDFIDCVLIAHNLSYGSSIFTFDKKIQKRLTD